MRVRKNTQYPNCAKSWTKAERKQLRRLYPKYSDGWLTREFGRTSSAITSQVHLLGLKKDVSKGYRGRDSNGRKWTDREIAFLRNHYKKMSLIDIAAAMGRGCNSVNIKANRLGLKKAKVWTSQEKEQLRKIYYERSINDLTHIFSRSRDSVKRQVRKMALPRKEPLWTNVEIKYLTKNYKRMTSTEIAMHVKHSPEAVRKKAQKLGFGRYQRPRVHPLLPWSEKELRYLKCWYGEKTASEVAKSLGRSTRAVVHKAGRLGFLGIRWKRFLDKRKNNKLKEPG